MKEDSERSLLGRDRWAEALTWRNTLDDADGGSLIYATCREWQDWYTDAENRRIFDDMSRLLAARDLYRERRRGRKIELDQDDYDLSQPIATWRRTQASSETCGQRSSAKSWWLLLSGAAAIAGLIALLPMQMVSNSAPPNAVVYQTSDGHLKDVHLSDGSSIILGGRTKLSVAFSAQRRAVNLVEGEAWFKVAHDSHWPFIVAAGDGIITDLGTAFLVTREPGRVVVTVTEGTVEVTARPAMWSPYRLVQRLSLRPSLVPVRLSRGEQLSLGDNAKLSRIRPTDTRAATAWTQGQLTFDDQPLRYVVAAVNRYFARPVVVSPSAGALRFSGIVSKRDLSDWLPSLEVIFPVTVDSQGANICIHMRATEGSRSCGAPP